MPTDTIKSIGSAGGRDYATLALWEAACPANLVTSDERWIGECYNDSEFLTGGQQLSIGGITTDATRYIILRCATGQSFADNASVRSNALYYNASNGVAIRATSSYVDGVLTCSVAYTRYHGLQIKTSAINSNTFRSGTALLAGIIVDSCLIESNARAANAAFACPGLVKNSILISTNSTGNGIGLTHNNTSNQLLGCTLINTAGTSGSATSSGYGAGHVMQNCAIFGWSSVGTTFFSSASYNATDLASAPGTNNQTSLTFASQFVNSASDFRADSAGSLDLNGTPDTTNLLTDISGTTRHATTPTIGCWEVVVAAGVVIPVFMNQYRQRVR